jgi:outer membrane protein insertion porin family
LPGYFTLPGTTITGYRDIGVLTLWGWSTTYHQLSGKRSATGQKFCTISSINITGAKMLQSSVILQNFNSFGLGQSQSFNQATLNQAVAGLKQEYISRGKQSVQITPEVTRLARNRVAIDIKIDEGASTKITDIQFEGNEHYSDRKLRNQMSLSEGGMWTWLTKSNQFNEQKFSQDMARVSEFYQNNGYFDFRILDTDIQTNDEKTKQTITVKVHEGERYRWGKVSIEGDTREVPKQSLKSCSP